MSTSSTLFQLHQDEGIAGVKFKELMATLPIQKEKNIEEEEYYLEEGARSI